MMNVVNRNVRHGFKMLLSILLACVLCLENVGVHAAVPENTETLATVTGEVTEVQAGTITITKQPQSAAIYEGEKVTIGVQATGTSLTYQWYYKLPGSATYTKWTGKTTAQFTYAPTAAKSGMQVYCLISDGYKNSITTASATLTVKKHLSITQENADLTVQEGEKAIFQVAAVGDGLTYQWYYKLPADKAFAKWNGRTAAKFSYVPAASKNGMQYYCVVTDAYGTTATSATATLTVKQNLAITQQPADLFCEVGGKVTFSVAATGTDLTYQWYFIMPGDKAFSPWTGRTAAKFSYAPSAGKNGMKYYCVVTDGSGKSLTSEIKTLTVKQALVITQQPTDLSCEPSGKVTFAVTATGTNLAYQWFFKMPSDKAFSAWTGRTAAMFSYAPAASKSGMQFYCVITDGSGNTVTSETRTLTIKQALAITQEPADITAQEGDTVTFQVAASGDKVTYQWYYKMASSTSFVKWTGRTAAKFNFVTALNKDGLQVYCVITDAYGNTLTSKTATLTVNPIVKDWIFEVGDVEEVEDVTESIILNLAMDLCRFTYVKDDFCSMRYNTVNTYDEEMAQVVQQFQKDRNLTHQDGKLYQETLDALDQLFLQIRSEKMAQFAQVLEEYGFEILDEDPNDIDDGTGRIQFWNVSFSYGQDETEMINDWKSSIDSALQDWMSDFKKVYVCEAGLFQNGYGRIICYFYKEAEPEEETQTPLFVIGDKEEGEDEILVTLRKDLCRITYLTEKEVKAKIADGTASTYDRDLAQKVQAFQQEMNLKYQDGKLYQETLDALKDVIKDVRNDIKNTYTRFLEGAGYEVITENPRYFNDPNGSMAMDEPVFILRDTPEEMMEIWQGYLDSLESQVGKYPQVYIASVNLRMEGNGSITTIFYRPGQPEEVAHSIVKLLNVPSTPEPRF